MTIFHASSTGAKIQAGKSYIFEFFLCFGESNLESPVLVVGTAKVLVKTNIEDIVF